MLDWVHSNKIYRQAAIRARQSRFSNPVSIVGSMSASVSAALILCVMAALLAYAMTATYTRKYVVSGVLQAESGSIAVYSPFDGQLSVDVVNGQLVSEGQRLGLIHVTGANASGASTVEQEIATVTQSISLTTDRVKLLSDQMDAYRQQYIVDMRRVKLDLEGLEDQRDAQQRQLEFIQDDFLLSEKLFEKKLITKDILTEKKEKIYQITRDLTAIKLKIKDAPINREKITQEWRVRSITLSQEDNLLKKELVSLRNQITSLQTKKASGIFSPIKGNVVFTRAQNGQVATSGTPLFRITPDEAKLVAKVFVPSSAIGFLKTGDEIKIRYSAFSYREHGVFTAVVTSVDRIAQNPGSIEAPFDLSEPVYVVQADIDQNPLSKNNVKLKVLPGMTLEATVNIDRKLLVLWLLGPIF